MSRFKRYLVRELGIEFKASLYFWAILFFYGTYRVLIGSLQADIIFMAEMIATTYIMGYIQVYLLRNFDETEKMGVFEVLACIGCSLFYGAESFVLSWFDKNIWVSLGFVGYMLVCYLGMTFVYYAKRHIETEMLNQELDTFKQKGES